MPLRLPLITIMPPSAFDIFAPFFAIAAIFASAVSLRCRFAFDYAAAFSAAVITYADARYDIMLSPLFSPPPLILMFLFRRFLRFSPPFLLFFSL